MLSRRGLIGGLLALSAPAIIRTPGLLMAVKPLQRWEHVTYRIGYQIVREEALPLTAEQIAHLDLLLAKSYAATKATMRMEVFRGDLSVADFLTSEDKWTNVPAAVMVTGARLVEV